MENGISLGRVAGFPLSIHWSVLVILWLFTWSLSAMLPEMAPGHGSSAYWVAGACGAGILLASLLAHELTHAVVARRSGVEVLGVTLWLFGGIARLGGEATTPKADFRIAASGPAMSLALAGAFAAAATALHAGGMADIAVAVAWWLAVINAILGLFNLLPGAPLDGGRILRAYLWHRHGDVTRAAIAAARAGRRLAYGLIAIGLFEFLVGSMVGGAWMAFLGWFLLTAAREEETAVRTRHALASLTIADVMTPDPHTVPGWIGLDAFIQDYLLGDRHSSYPVQRMDGTISGLMTLAQLRNVAAERRASTLVADAAIPIERVPTARPGESVTAVLERLGPSAGRRVLVTDDSGQVVGIVAPGDFGRLVEVRMLASSGVDSA